MGRNILFITTDQQRYDALGCNGGTDRPHAGRRPARPPRASATGGPTTRTPCACRRARTMLTGQYLRTHGVVANGIALPGDAPRVAAYLAEQGRVPHRAHRQGALRAGVRPATTAGRRTPAPPAATPAPGGASSTPSTRSTSPRSGAGRCRTTDAGWRSTTPSTSSFASLLGAEPGGDTGAPETKHNPIPRGWYHTDWVADRAIDWLDTAAGRRRLVLLAELPRSPPPLGPARSPRCTGSTGASSTCPPVIRADADRSRKLLADRPAHWLRWY